MQINAELEGRVDARTKQLDDASKEAVKIGTTDHLTRIANRLNHSVHLNSCLQTGQHGTAVGLLFIELVGFKLINDNFGHQHGDQLLAIAGRLRDLKRAEDLVARVAGDEFAIVLLGKDGISVSAARWRAATSSKGGSSPA